MDVLSDELLLGAGVHGQPKICWVFEVLGSIPCALMW